jgi:predicted nucleic acid-binding protein
VAGLHQHYCRSRIALWRRQETVAQLSAQLDKELDAMEILPFEAPAEVVYAELRSRIEEVGRSAATTC